MSRPCSLDSRIRSHFPMLRRQIDGRNVVYLDSAATGLKPACVMEAEHRYNALYTANIHRGRHVLSEEASDAFENARGAIAALIDASPDEVVFLSGATEAINQVAFGLRLDKLSKVLLGDAEHHSNIVPWMHYATVAWCQGNPAGRLDVDHVVRCLAEERPRVFAFSMVSNVTGVVQPAKELCRAAREVGALSVVDVSQAIGHGLVKWRELDADFMAFSGHKMYGPTGIGVLVGKRELLERLMPLRLGGGAVEVVGREGFTLKEVPYRFEAGTPHIAGAIGLGAAARFLSQIGHDALLDHQGALYRGLVEAVREEEHITPICVDGQPSLAIMSLVPSETLRLSAHQIAELLSTRFAIMVRSGHHCAQPMLQVRGIPHGSLRASAGLYTTQAEIAKFGDAIRYTSRLFGDHGGTQCVTAQSLRSRNPRGTTEMVH